MDINELLTRGVTHAIVKEDLEKALKSGKKLKVKLGVDPTGKDLHIGHAIPLLALRRFMEAGHEIHLIVGDFTARIGDTSDKNSMRPDLAADQIEENMKTYKQQASKVLDFSKVKLHYNSEWLNKLDFNGIVELAKQFTVAQMIERDNYSNRYKEGKPIGLHEFMYPLMQGYDSVALKADIELGGNDQLFNCLAGRSLQEHFGQKPQNVITFELLMGTDGQKMSKSIGNTINILDEPNDKYGKTMRIPDEQIITYFTLTTNVPLTEIDKIAADLKRGANPRDAKAKLAYEITKLYDGEEAATAAEKNFNDVFAKGGLPDDIATKKMGKKEWNIVELLAEAGLVSSKSEAKRLIEQKGIKVDEKAVESMDEQIILGKKILLQVGKRKFLYVE